MNDCLYPPRSAPVKDRDRLVAIFYATFANQADLQALSPAARRVLATAAALFYQRGAADTSVRDLTRACGLTPGALYNHFASKDELLDTIVQTGHAGMQRRIEDALKSGTDDPSDRLRTFVRAYVGAHLAAPELAQVVRREYLHLSPERYRTAVAQRRRIRRLLESIIEAGVHAGQFDLVGGPSARTGQTLMVLDLCSRTSEWFDPSGPTDADELTERYVAVVDRMVCAGTRAR